MTEIEAIKVFENPTKHITKLLLDEEETICYSSDMVKAFETAIQALSEIQQYRSIGTVKEIRIREAQFKRLSEGYLNDLTSLREYQSIGTVEELKTMKENGAFTGVELAQILAMQMELKKYQSIGTIEEFKALKEKNVAKKAIGKRKYDEAYCPACNEVISDGEFWSLAEYVHHCNYCGQAVKGVDWSE